MPEDKQVSSSAWMYTTIPANIASGPLSTLIPLYILATGGSVIAVALAIAVYNAVSIPSSFVWGRIADTVRRKTLILLSYLVTAVLLGFLLFEKDITAIIFSYAGIAFMTGASSTPLNLLVMDTSPKDMWSGRFSLLQTITSFGNVIGLIIGVVATIYSSLSVLIVVLSASVFASFLLSIFMINDKFRPQRHEVHIRDFGRFLKNLFMPQNLIVKMPVYYLMNTISLKKINEFRRSYLYLLYLTSLIFYLGTGIFNGEYVVGLKYHGISQSGVFEIIFIAMVLQAIAFRYSHLVISATKRNPIPFKFVGVRGICYMLIGISFVILGGSHFFYANMLLYITAAGIAYSVFYVGSYTLLFNTLKGEQGGRWLGYYSTIAGVGNFIGAFASGLMAVDFGFWSVFVGAGALMIVSAYGFSKL
jgi:MFS family permease